jgi:hypothetical protein
VHPAVQWAVSVSEAQVWFGQAWKVALQVGTHAPPAQATLSALLGVTHGVQDVPQLATSVLDRQVGAEAVPHWWKPGVAHSTPQASGSPSQVAMPLAGGAGHGVQEVPQLVTANTDWHVPAAVLGQRW